MLDRARQAAQASRQVAVVEVLGEQAGWLALQSGIASGADAVVIPELPCDLNDLAAELQSRVTVQRPFGLVVVAQGARFVADTKDGDAEAPINPLRASLSPMATEPSGAYAINRSGCAAETVANGLQLRTNLAAKPMVLGPWARGGASSAAPSTRWTARMTKVHVNWDLASGCTAEHTALCPTAALYMFGEEMTVDQVLDEVPKDASFYRNSGSAAQKSGCNMHSPPLKVMPPPTIVASTRRSKQPATFPGHLWKKCYLTSIQCCMTTSCRSRSGTRNGPA